MTADEPVIRAHMIFSGVVQGVGFRRRAQRAAESLGCTGWVRNNRVGTVSMELQGTEAQIDQVIQVLKHAPYIRITDINTRLIPVDPRESAFVRKAEH